MSSGENTWHHSNQGEPAEKDLKKKKKRENTNSHIAQRYEKVDY